MTVPKTLRVQLPQTFAWLLKPFGGPLPAIAGLDGQWVRLAGTPLPLPVAVRIDQAEDGRFIVTGLLIGLQSRQEITWETMRAIRPASLLAWIFSGFDPQHPRRQYEETDPSPPQLITGADFDTQAWIDGEDPDSPEIIVGSPEHKAHMRAMVAYELWKAAALNQATEVDVETVTRPRASVAVDLTEFARVYDRHRRVNPRRATTATAEEMHISRATAIRRLSECRSKGLLPPRDESSHG